MMPSNHFLRKGFFSKNAHAASSSTQNRGLSNTVSILETTKNTGLQSYAKDGDGTKWVEDLRGAVFKALQFNLVQNPFLPKVC